jgi:hypothetical protein
VIGDKKVSGFSVQVFYRTFAKKVAEKTKVSAERGFGIRVAPSKCVGGRLTLVIVFIKTKSWRGEKVATGATRGNDAFI